ncbi:MAG: Uma2 family endonuclease [Nitrospirae bacterium]|nr:Uma2 family endonuclease [Nitrospirota bacterium]
MLRQKVKLTYNEYFNLPDEKRYELMDGDLYMVPAPDFYHQIVSRNIEFALWSFVKKKMLGEVVDAPVDVVLSEEDVLQPDIIYISNERRGIVTEKNVSGPPDLVIEILSPSTKERDRLVKRSLYALHGVKEYWIVDPAAQSIEVMHLINKVFDLYGIFSLEDTLTSPLIEGFLLPLKEVFV